jgi:hypothetical protein
VIATPELMRRTRWQPCPLLATALTNAGTHAVQGLVITGIRTVSGFMRRFPFLSTGLAGNSDISGGA